MRGGITEILNWIFPWIAMTGLVLVGWGLLTTPDEFREGQEMSGWRTNQASSDILEK